MSALPVHVYPSCIKFGRQETGVIQGQAMQNFMRALEDGVLPGDNAQIFEDRGCKFVNGALVIELHDHRFAQPQPPAAEGDQSQQPENQPPSSLSLSRNGLKGLKEDAKPFEEVRIMHLRPTSRSVWKDAQALSDKFKIKSGKPADIFQVESKLLLASKPDLDLTPSISVVEKHHMDVYNEQKFNFVRKKRRIAKVQRTEDKERDKYYEMMLMMDHRRRKVPEASRRRLEIIEAYRKRRVAADATPSVTYNRERRGVPGQKRVVRTVRFRKDMTGSGPIYTTFNVSLLPSGDFEGELRIGLIPDTSFCGQSFVYKIGAKAQAGAYVSSFLKAYSVDNTPVFDSIAANAANAAAIKPSPVMNGTQPGGSNVTSIAPAMNANAMMMAAGKGNGRGMKINGKKPMPSQAGKGPLKGISGVGHGKRANSPTPPAMSQPATSMPHMQGMQPSSTPMQIAQGNFQNSVHATGMMPDGTSYTSQDMGRPQMSLEAVQQYRAMQEVNLRMADQVSQQQLAMNATLSQARPILNQGQLGPSPRHSPSNMPATTSSGQIVGFASSQAPIYQNMAAGGVQHLTNGVQNTMSPQSQVSRLHTLSPSPRMAMASPATSAMSNSKSFSGSPQMSNAARANMPTPPPQVPTSMQGMHPGNFPPNSYPSNGPRPPQVSRGMSPSMQAQSQMPTPNSQPQQNMVNMNHVQQNHVSPHQATIGAVSNPQQQATNVNLAMLYASQGRPPPQVGMQPPGIPFAGASGIMQQSGMPQARPQVPHTQGRPSFQMPVASTPHQRQQQFIMQHQQMMQILQSQNNSAAGMNMMNPALMSYMQGNMSGMMPQNQAQLAHNFAQQMQRPSQGQAQMGGMSAQDYQTAMLRLQQQQHLLAQQRQQASQQAPNALNPMRHQLMALQNGPTATQQAAISGNGFNSFPQMGGAGMDPGAAAFQMQQLAQFYGQAQK